MYLYLYQSEYKDKLQSGNGLQSRTYLSERLVHKALADYFARKIPDIPASLLQETEIMRGPKGKPYFAGLPKTDIKGMPAVHFSVSHSGNRWGCLMADEPVGFDLEMCREKVSFMQIANHYFTEHECELILSEGKDMFFEIWVRKEAYVKYLGTGLAEGLSSFSVAEEGRLLQQISTTNGTGRSRMPCFIYPVTMGDDIRSAYCTGSGKQIEKIIWLEYEQTN